MPKVTPLNAKKVSAVTKVTPIKKAAAKKIVSKNVTATPVTKKAIAKKVIAKKVSTPAKKKDYNKLALALHKKLHGKIEVISKGRLSNRDEWSTMYSPGVGAVSSFLAKHPKEARNYTIKRNTVAVISDGSAVLGLGNLGAIAALPVMEGKCAIFKEMAGVDAFPIVLGTQDPEEIIAAIKAIAPTFGGINLEDIAAPHCFMIEERLKRELDIPVMHDDQHGTAIVVLAGLINAAKVVGKKLETLRVVIVGAGAAGRAVTLLLQKAGITNIIITDTKGAIYAGRPDLVGYKKELANSTNSEKLAGDVMSVIAGADVIVGVSGPGTIAAAHIEKMAPRAIVFAWLTQFQKSCPRTLSALEPWW